MALVELANFLIVLVPQSPVSCARTCSQRGGEVETGEDGAVLDLVFRGEYIGEYDVLDVNGWLDEVYLSHLKYQHE